MRDGGAWNRGGTVLRAADVGRRRGAERAMRARGGAAAATVARSSGTQPRQQQHPRHAAAAAATTAASSSGAQRRQQAGWGKSPSVQRLAAPCQVIATAPTMKAGPAIGPG
ncbi:hypothetical protein PLESTF_001313300 [Pleodorina starrii]|nr:hypothetical protein PLESTF_001313300 [Pleodorina starrii]